jgi:hypothetical protein
MRTPEEKREMMRQQVISKIRWGAREQEVVDWLQEEYGIVGPESEELLTEAWRARHKAIRQNALIRLVLSIIGILGVAIFFYTRLVVGLGVIFYGIVGTVDRCRIGDRRCLA